MQVCTQLSLGGTALNSICDGLSSAPAGPPAVAAISSSVRLLATDLKNGLVLHVKTGLQKMQLLHARRRTELLSLDELKQGLTDAMAGAKKVFLEELANAITLVAQEIVSALSKVICAPTVTQHRCIERLYARTHCEHTSTDCLYTCVAKVMESLKTELSKQADNAVSLATKALDTLKQTLAKMPESVKTTIVGLCKPLGTELQLACGDGAAGIIVNMTTAVGNICKAGVAAMLDKANST